MVNRIPVRTVQASEYSDLKFKYILEIPRCECILGSTRKPTTGKVYIFLIFNQEDRIYRRNGLQGTWEEVAAPDDYWQIRSLVTEAIKDKSVPCYRVNNFKII